MLVKMYDRQQKSMVPRSMAANAAKGACEDRRADLKQYQDEKSL
jgi:hypothetical protein